MKYILLICFYSTLIACKKQAYDTTSNDSLHSIQDYVDDSERINLLRTVTDCDSIIKLLTNVTSIDFLSTKESKLRECGVDFYHPYNTRVHEQYPKIDRILSDILTDDQMIRDSLANLLSFKDDMNRHEYITFKRSILHTTDSLNLVKFDSLIRSLGEWVGAKYRDLHPSSPRIEIFISHLDAKHYVKYTLMAYRSAQVGKEYWSRMKKLISFAPKYILHDEHILKHNIYMVPFRFVEYTDNHLLNERSDLTVLEFQNVSQNELAQNGKVHYELISAYVDDEKRMLLLHQAESILLKQGLPKESVTIDYKKDTLTSYKLSYKLNFN